MTVFIALGWCKAEGQLVPESGGHSLPQEQALWPEATSPPHHRALGATLATAPQDPFWPQAEYQQSCLGVSSEPVGLPALSASGQLTQRYLNQRAEPDMVQHFALHAPATVLLDQRAVEESSRDPETKSQLGCFRFAASNEASAAGSLMAHV